MYCDFSPLRMAILTWNCDGQDPALLQRTEASRNLFASFLQRLDRPDLVVFNFQEVRYPPTRLLEPLADQ